jgi:hypothetical protein
MALFMAATDTVPRVAPGAPVPTVILPETAAPVTPPVAPRAIPPTWARDLLFEREQASGSGGANSASTFVVNRDELGRSVAASIELVHQP